MSLHICTSRCDPAPPDELREVCGVCWWATDGCKCWAVEDIGTVMFDGESYLPMWGRDLMERIPVGYPKETKENAAQVLVELRDTDPHLACRKCDRRPICRSLALEKK